MSWKRLAGIAAGVLVGLVASSVAADYLGPERTASIWVWQRRECHYQAYLWPNSYCQLYLYDAPDTTCPSAGSTAPYFNNHPNAFWTPRRVRACKP